MKNDLLPHSSATTAWTTYGNISFMKTFMLYMWISRSSSSSTRAAESKKQFFLLLIFPLFFHIAFSSSLCTPCARTIIIIIIISRAVQMLKHFCFASYNGVSCCITSPHRRSRSPKKRARRSWGEGKKMKVQGQEIEFLCWSSLSLSLSLLFYALCFTFSFFFTRSLHLLLFHSLTHSARRTAM